MNFWTYDLLNPNQARYQASLIPDENFTTLPRIAEDRYYLEPPSFTIVRRNTLNYFANMASVSSTQSLTYDFVAICGVVKSAPCGSRTHALRLEIWRAAVTLIARSRDGRTRTCIDPLRCHALEVRSDTSPFEIERSSLSRPNRLILFFRQTLHH